MSGPRIGDRIRGTRPYHFRSGEWATIRGRFIGATGVPCWYVEFPDEKTDVWPVDDPDYEYQPCPFCALADKTNSVRGSVKVNGRYIVRDRPRPVMYFEPLNPVTPGHLLFVPAFHAEHGDVEAAVTALRSAYEYGSLAPDGGPPEDFNLIVSSGQHATQTISHLHVHYIPRRDGDGLGLLWTGQQQ